MTFEQFQIFIKPLAVHFGMVKDKPTWRLYHAALMVEPTPSRPLLDRALVRAASTRRFFPGVSELRDDAETERRLVLGAHPFTHLSEVCGSNGGWIEAPDADGVIRASRCRCAARWAGELAAIGVGTATLALPAGQEELAS